MLNITLIAFRMSKQFLATTTPLPNSLEFLFQLIESLIIKPEGTFIRK